MHSKAEMDALMKRFPSLFAPKTVFLVSEIENGTGAAEPLHSFQTRAGAKDFIDNQPKNRRPGYDIEEIPHSGY